MKGVKMRCMLRVLRTVFNEVGASAALEKVETWNENGWLYPQERRLLYEYVARCFEPPALPSCDCSGFDYYSECISLSEFYEEE